MVQSHDNQFAELMPYLTRIETRFMEIKDQLDRVENQTVSEVVERTEAQAKMHQDIQDVKQGMDFMAADFENAAGLGTKHPVPDDCTTSRRSVFGPTESRENAERGVIFQHSRLWV